MSGHNGGNGGGVPGGAPDKPIGQGYWGGRGGMSKSPTFQKTL